MDKFINKENVFIAFVVIWMLIQSGYFATKLDVAQLRNEVLQQKLELQKYSDDGDKMILKELDLKYDKILSKLERLK